MTGCRDKTHQKDKRVFEDNYDLYFAKRSSLWGGGVCFIKEGNSKTLFKLYLISSDQFKDILLQECSLNRMDKKIYLELDKKDHLFDDRSWYGKILFLKEYKGYPIYTITAPGDYSDELLNPNRYYVYHLIKGLYEIHDLTKEDIERYLIDKRGFDDMSELTMAFEIYDDEKENFY